MNLMELIIVVIAHKPFQYDICNADIGQSARNLHDKLHEDDENLDLRREIDPNPRHNNNEFGLLQRCIVMVKPST